MTFMWRHGNVVEEGRQKEPWGQKYPVMISYDFRISGRLWLNRTSFPHFQKQYLAGGGYLELSREGFAALIGDSDEKNRVINLRE